MVQTYPVVDTDRQGSISGVIENDGSTLTMDLDGGRFVGEELRWL